MDLCYQSFMETLLHQVGRIIRDERSSRRLTVAELAEAARIPVLRLEALESGHPGVTMSEVDRLAEALDLDPAALANGERLEVVSPAVFLRHAAEFQDLRAEDAGTFARALEQGRALWFLADEQVKARVMAIEPVQVVEDSRPNAAARQGYELARRVRQVLLQPVEPMGDMRSLLEDEFGIAVVQAPLVTTRLPAASVRCAQRDGGAVILDASDEHRRVNPLLDRVHLAHELCHLLFDPKESGIQIVLETEGKEDLFEQRARAFAAELLVPSTALSELLRHEELRTNGGARLAAIRVRETFLVPWELTVHHLENHEWITGRMAEELLAGGPGAYAKPRTRLPAPGEPSIGLCLALERAVMDAVATEGQVRALLGTAPGQAFPWESHGRAA